MNIFNKLKKKKDDITLSAAIEIPEYISNMQLPDPPLKTYYRNEEKRTLWIDDEININSLEYAKMIIDWNRTDKEKKIPLHKRIPIRLMFFSPGGDLDVNNCLVDVVQLSETPIIGINMGMCSSAACILFLSCHKRYAMPNSQFMIHKGSGTFSGTFDELIAALETYQQDIENMGNFILQRTSIPKEEFEEHFSTDWYLTADEAMKYGVVHKIATSLDDIF